MSSGILPLSIEHTSPLRPEYRTPAELIGSSTDARQLFSEFIGRFVGSMEFADRMTGAATPPLERLSYDSEQMISYPTAQISGYTGLGKLVHVRLNIDHQIPENRYFVAVGDLNEGTLREEYVKSIEYQSSTIKGLETTLRLGHRACASWPDEYAPSIYMPQQGAFYSPGFRGREERLYPIDTLYHDVASLDEPAAHLRVV